MVELYRNENLVGEEFPADVQYYPTDLQLPTIQDPKQVDAYIITA